MNRILVCAFVCWTVATLGCDRLATKTPNASASDKPAAAVQTGGTVGQKGHVQELKTVDDAKAHLQQQIDRFLGGDRPDEVTHAVLDLPMQVESKMGAQFDSVTIESVLPKYSEKGEKVDNTFAARIKLSLVDSHGRKREMTIQQTMFYVGGKWMW
jgi:hypothetical protein